jgi:hypothetical protein
LGHAVALANGHLLIFQRLEIGSDTKRRTYLILAAVTPADALGIVILYYPIGAQAVENVAGQTAKRLFLA